MPSLRSIALWSFATLSSFSVAHPGEDHVSEALAKREFFERTPNLQKRCAPVLKARGHTDRAVNRRRNLAESTRRKRGIPVEGAYKGKRDLTSVLATDHNQTTKYSDATIATPIDTYFEDETSALLWPEFELAEGPYYVKQELVRYNGIEDQIGIGLILDLQVVDVETCEPVANQFVEFWGANQTGVYSGTVGNGNGNENDLTNLNKTFQRAIQSTDSDGVVQVELLFPGHYAPRATHLHVVIHQGDYVLPNDTLTYNHVSHVGQIFFDQDLIDDADYYYPYTENPNAILPNTQDYALALEAADTDPITNYLYIGDDLSEGLIGWITLGINASAVYDLDPAAWWTANGGVENPVQPNAGG